MKVLRETHPPYQPARQATGTPQGEVGQDPPARPEDNHLSIGLWASLWDPAVHRHAAAPRQRVPVPTGGSAGDAMGPLR